MAKLTKMLGKYGAAALLHIFFVAALYGTQDVSTRVVFIRDRNPISAKRDMVEQTFAITQGGTY